MQKKFSYPLKIADLKQNEYKFLLDADEAELVDISEILQVEKVYYFKAEIKVRPNIREHMLRVWGQVKAELELQSVITLKNFRQKYDVPFELFFDTKATYKDLREMAADINADVPDVVENGIINLADIALEQIALQIDDYPRAKGEVFRFQAPAAEDAPEKQNPFAVLQKLKK